MYKCDCVIRKPSLSSAVSWTVPLSFTVFQAGVAKSKAGLGIGVSTLYKEEETIQDCDKTLFDWLKENDVEQVGSLLQTKSIDVNAKDSEVRIVKMIIIIDSLL